MLELSFERLLVMVTTFPGAHVTIENYHASIELKLVQNLQTCVLALPNLPLQSPDTDSEDQSEYHKNTIFNNFTIY